MHSSSDENPETCDSAGWTFSLSCPPSKPCLPVLRRFLETTTLPVSPACDSVWTSHFGTPGPSLSGGHSTHTPLPPTPRSSIFGMLCSSLVSALNVRRVQKAFLPGLTLESGCQSQNSALHVQVMWPLSNDDPSRCPRFLICEMIANTNSLLRCTRC